MKRVLVVLAVLSLLAVGQLAQATYLDSSWYAQLTNVRTYGAEYSQDPFWGSTYDSQSTHIYATATTGTATFSIIQAGYATTGEYASWGNACASPWNYMGSISFDYTTYWTQPNLVLILESWDMLMPEHEVLWSSSTTGQQTGHVEILADYHNGYRFTLAVAPEVPEPGSLLALGSLCAAGLAAGSRKMRGQS